MEEIVDILEKRGACDSSLDWLRRLPLGATPQVAWEQCENGSWLLWLLVRAYPKSKEYHQFILRSANRAIAIAGGGADSTLVQAVRDKESWLLAATEKELAASITWPKDAAWQAGLSLAWDHLGKHDPEWVGELRARADDLRSLFSRPDPSLLVRKPKV